MSDVINIGGQGAAAEDTRTGMSADALRQAIEDHLRYTLGRPAALLEPKHYYHALALAVRDRMQDRWAATTQTYVDLSRKVTAYLSAEFLLGPHLGNNLLNLQIEDQARAALAALGQDIDEVLACEQEPGLGNGGLGRLAACFLDAFATLGLPSFGYGLRYRYGMFAQRIHDGQQVEEPDDWLRHGKLADTAHGWLLVHAGVVPQWTAEQTLALAGEVQTVLRGPGMADLPCVAAMPIRRAYSGSICATLFVP